MIGVKMSLEREHKTIVCEKHGEYEADELSLFGGQKKFLTVCPKCREEAELKQSVEMLEKKWMAHRLAIKVPDRYKGADFDNYVCSTESQKNVVEYLRNYAGKENVIIHGERGTGKTHLLWALAKSFLGARYYRLLDLLRRFRVSYSKNGGETEQDILNEAGGYPLLILDEIGRQCGSAFEYNTIFDIIDTRYNNRLPTILCSNLPITGTESITAFLGIAAMDRLNENSVEISCNWENYRRGKR